MNIFHPSDKYQQSDKYSPNKIGHIDYNPINKTTISCVRP